MRYILLSVVWLLAAIISYSQEIQTLPADPAISSGTLPNGMTYYIARNPLYKGMADFALVQRTGARTVEGVERSRIVEISQQALSLYPRLQAPTVQDFFARHGVVAGRNGYVEVTDDATIFRFRNVFIAETPTMMDSTLLVMLGIADRCSDTEDEFLKNWYAPSDQAIIVAGDVDAGKISEKLKMLSYMTPASPSEPRQDYIWKEDGVNVCIDYNGLRELVSVSASWKLPRTPRESMNTVQPVIYERFMTEMGIVARERIINILKARKIPFADVSYEYENSVASLGDEKFRVSLSVSPDHMMDAISVLASVMSGIDAADVRADELKRADRIYLERMRKSAVQRLDNADYVDMCVAAFMYNASLATQENILNFHTSKVLDDSSEVSLFNSVVSASIDPSRNLVIGCSGKVPQVSADEIAGAFDAAWKNASEYDRPDFLREPHLWEMGEKVKIKSSKKEHMSDGTVWTLSNGFRVIFKKMPTDDIVYYSLAMNGGYVSLPDIQTGDGAYISDYLDFCTIGGVDADTFRDALRLHGMTMEFKVNMSNVTMKGMVPDDGLEYLVRALLTVMNDRAVDEDAFAAYRAGEPLRLEMDKGTVRERMAAVDSIICPDYRYTSYRAAGRLSGSLAERADAYIDNLASKMNDAVLVLAGDIDETLLKKVLVMYADGFKTREHAFIRPSVSYQPISGEVMYTLDGESNSVDIVMSAPIAMTSDNYYAAVMASMALRKSLVQAVSGTGMTLDLVHDFCKYPQERFNIKVSLTEASVEGFAPGSARDEPMEAMSAVSRRLKTLDSMEISEDELSSYKSLMKKIMSISKGEPEYWLRAIPMRYLDGKDLTTGCDARIDAVTTDRIKSLLKSLAEGARVEYIISKK